MSMSLNRPFPTGDRPTLAETRDPCDHQGNVERFPMCSHCMQDEIEDLYRWLRQTRIAVAVLASQPYPSRKRPPEDK